MRNAKRMIFFAVIVVMVSFTARGFAVDDPCQTLWKGKGAGRIDSVSIVPQSGGLPEYCQVIGTLRSAIGYEVRLPTTEWNGKFYMAGCGGFCGYINAAVCDPALGRGYAIAVTDTGHIGSALDGSFGLDNPQAEKDWGFRAIHLVADATKKIIRKYYGRWPEYSYFEGCSTGGRQGLMEAQRFPDDFDGIIAGDPANYQTGLPVSQSWFDLVNHDDMGQKILTFDKMPLISDSVFIACDGLDGLIDGLIDDPRNCYFDPTVLLCHDGNEDLDCLSQAQVDVLIKLYGSAKNSDGEILYPGGLPKGSEAAWPGWSVGIGAGLSGGGNFAQECLRYLMFKHDPGESYSVFDFDYDEDVEALKAKAWVYNASNPDLKKFRDRGCKLMLYHGWADPLITPFGTIHYYEQVAQRMGGLPEIQKWFRLYLFPGMNHCGGGPGPNTFDLLTALENWVEQGIAPDKIVAAHFTIEGVLDRTRPVYPYPMVARFKGTGSIDDADNFVGVLLNKVFPADYDWDVRNHRSKKFFMPHDDDD